MEYLIGFLLAFVLFSLLSRVVATESKKHMHMPIKYSQSHMYQILRPFISVIMTELKNNKATQAKKHFDKGHVRIVFSETEAFWIADNKLFKADLIDGEIDEDSANVVDTMAMDKVELDRVMFIVEKLTEGLTNDSGNTGN